MRAAHAHYRPWPFHCGPTPGPESRNQVADEAELDDAGVPWVPRLGGRAPLGAELEHVARTGQRDRSRHAGRSEARMAVLGAAAARGWRLADIRSAIASGAWKGLAALYERRSEPGRMDRLLPYEWRKAIDGISQEKNVRQWHTSDSHTRPPVDESEFSAEYGHVRQWMTAVLCAAEDPYRVKGWGRRVIAVRLVLLALGQAAMVSGSSTIEFGTRNLALHSALSHRTVSRVLRLLRDEPDPLIDLVSPRQMARADRYQLRIPDKYADSVRWRRRRAGRVEAVHPVFLALGGTAGLVYQALGPDEVGGAEAARAARVSASAASAALRVLAEHGLAERGPGGWRRGDARLADVAESTGAAALQAEREARYKQDREGWRARLRQYASARNAPVAPGDGWLGLDDEDDWAAAVLRRRLPGPAGAGGVAAVRRAGQDLLHPDVVPPPGEEVVLVGEPLAGPQAEPASRTCRASRLNPAEPGRHSPYSTAWMVNRCRCSSPHPNAACKIACRPAMEISAGTSSRRRTIGLIPASTTRSWYTVPVTGTPSWATMPIVPVPAWRSRRFPATSRAAGPMDLRTGVSGRCPPRSLSCPEK